MDSVASSVTTPDELNSSRTGSSAARSAPPLEVHHALHGRFTLLADGFFLCRSLRAVRAHLLRLPTDTHADELVSFFTTAFARRHRSSFCGFRLDLADA
jgi:hypothetical protein